MADDGRILVTGATGFLGSVLTRQLVSEGVTVRIFRRETSSLQLLGNAAESVEHFVGDLSRARDLYDAMHEVDRVYHVAAKVSFDPRERNAIRKVNAEGTANVVNAALQVGIDRLVHTSSIAALGRPLGSDEVIDEETPWDGGGHRSAYAHSKRRAELEVHRGIAEGLDAVLVNPSLVFGVGGPESATRRIVDAVRSGWVWAAPPGGTNVVDVRDVAEGHRAAMRHGESGRRYILGGENRSWDSILSMIAEAFGVDPPRYTLPKVVLTAGAALSEAVAAVVCTKPFLPRETARSAARNSRFDNGRAREELGCTFRPFDETVERIATALE